MSKEDKPLPEVDIEANLRLFFANSNLSIGAQANERAASFDYCYNYFQSFRKKEGGISEIASDKNLEMSCLQIGFYLASWGMFRGKSFLLQKSVHHYSSLIKLIADSNEKLWEIDVDKYNDEGVIDLLLGYEEKIRESISEEVDKDRKASEILTTKVMMGVFGNIPGFDSYFNKGFQAPSPLRQSLDKILRYYKKNKAEIDSHRIFTLDLLTGEKTDRLYPKAKIIDMVFFIEGDKLFQAKAAEIARVKSQDKI